MVGGKLSFGAGLSVPSRLELKCQMKHTQWVATENQPCSWGPCRDWGWGWGGERQGAPGLCSQSRLLNHQVTHTTEPLPKHGPASQGRQSTGFLRKGSSPLLCLWRHYLALSPGNVHWNVSWLLLMRSKCFDNIEKFPKIKIKDSKWFYTQQTYVVQGLFYRHLRLCFSKLEK